MGRQSVGLDDRLLEYLRSVSLHETPTMVALREETAKLPYARMQIAPEQGQFMALLIRLLGARRCIEVGTFTGYSALVCAGALPPDGRLVALDVSEEWTAIARQFWERGGVAERIDLRIGPAEASLRAMLSAGESGRYDFMFVDADKQSYQTYAELGLELLRPGGLLAFDNVLWGGSVADPANQKDDTLALRAFNRWLHQREGLAISMVPIGDGLTLARKPD
ncbi:MAG: class I SAM-dependent methyltransferase [Gammaproteobacteria bacterium]|nr:class I SAM-dependent methyltransferase [Gammaproteobacteria bacterium]